MSIRFYGLRAL